MSETEKLLNGAERYARLADDLYSAGGSTDSDRACQLSQMFSQLALAKLKFLESL